ncbi:uncharacterized protein [Halyomorpha halys]|uniref:uncharacterized protein isoform X2 n=1 Tax=Halyomorpha halys TaxID=286706 RepID=UPI0034D2BACE
MAKTFKPSPFENIIKKYTLCSICDGKIINSPFLQCGCSVILCIYCNEKHSCKFHHQAVKFDSYEDNKSISFINQLSALMSTNPSEKDKEKKGLLESSCSTSLPDLDDLMVDETVNSELSFSQLFDDNCSRNEKPRNSISSIKRESISPRISYTLKRKLYLSDSEDDESFNKSESTLSKRLSDCSSVSKKKIAKKIKFSNKSRNSSIFSTIGSDSESVNSERQTPVRKSKNRKNRHSVPAGISLGVSSSSQNRVSSPVPESCLTVQENILFLEDKTHVKNNFDTENNSSCFHEFNEKKNIKNAASPVLNMLDDNISSQFKLCANSIDRAFENNSLEENINGLKMCSPCKLDDNEITKSDLVNDINGINQVIKQEDLKPKVYSNSLKKHRSSIKNNKESKRHRNKTDKEKKYRDNDTLNCNEKDFDGFEQYDINGSVLNYMLYNLTMPFNKSDEKMLPIHYKGKTFIIHLTDKFDAESNDNVYHYILKPFKTSVNNFVQTEPQMRAESIGITQTDDCGTADACVGQDAEETCFIETDSYQSMDIGVGRDGEKTCFVQTDRYQVLDACVGRDGEKTGFVQTDSYQMVDACVGRNGEKTSFIQTDSYQVVDACVGHEGKISKVSQTDNYLVRDSCTSTMDFRCCGVQTDSVNNSSCDLWSRNCNVVAVQTDLLDKKASDKNSDMPYSNVNLHSSSDMVRPYSSEITKKVTADVREYSDNEDEDIIEGTPVKVNNMSITSLNLSSIKAPNFDWEESTAARDEIVSCSDLTNVDKLCVQKFTKCFGMEYSEYFNNKTTHLVVSPRLTNDSHKTFKYLIAIASKACIVSIDWVKDSLLRKEVLPVDKYVPTNQPGPMRCRMNVDLPFSGLTICVQLLTNYPGVRAMEALSKLCGAHVVEDIEQYNSPQDWPFPRFCLFEDEHQMTSQILNSCSKNHVVAINYEWIYDSVAAYHRQPILKYLCSTFILTDDIIKKYKIPSDMLVDNCT